MAGRRSLLVTYRIGVSSEQEARSAAREIALEQTAELPESLVGDAIGSRVVGRLEKIVGDGGSRYHVTWAYPEAAAGGEVLQTLNLLFGNISLKRGILLTGVEWTEAALAPFPGPRFGSAGLRDLCGAPASRPLLATALKPLGSSAAELAALAGRFAAGGMDIVKDDHGLADQGWAPFAERVRRCQDAVRRHRCLYLPNVTGPAETLDERLEIARSAGCRGVLVSPMLAGLDVFRGMAASSGLALLAHPALTGTFFGSDHGIAAELLLGQLFRLLGADGVIYPNAGGRFAFTESTCEAINTALRGPLADRAPSFPVPAGGIDVADLPHWANRYGPETIFLIGGSLYLQPDIASATERLRSHLQRPD